MSRLTKQPGVYCIVNTTNGKMYVGSAVTICGRVYAHRSCLRRGKHDNIYLQRAWDKYGEAAFKFEVLELCLATNCIHLEQWWIDKLEVTNREKGYNICPAAGSAMTGRKHTEESRKKMSEGRKGRDMSAATKAAAEVNTGKHRSDETKEKIANSNKGVKKSAEHSAAVIANHWSKREDAAEIAARIVEKRPKTLTPEHRARIAEGGKRRWERHRLHATTN